MLMLKLKKEDRLLLSHLVPNSNHSLIRLTSSDWKVKERIAFQATASSSSLFILSFPDEKVSVVEFPLSPSSFSLRAVLKNQQEKNQEKNQEKENQEKKKQQDAIQENRRGGSNIPDPFSKNKTVFSVFFFPFLPFLSCCL